MFHILRSSDIISIAVIFIFCLPVSLEFFLCSYRSNLSQVIFKIDVMRNFKISYTKPAVSNSLLNRRKKKIWKKPSQQLCSRRLILVLSMLSAKESRQTDHFISTVPRSCCSQFFYKISVLSYWVKLTLKHLGYHILLVKLQVRNFLQRKVAIAGVFLLVLQKKKKKNRSAAFYNMIG